MDDTFRGTDRYQVMRRVGEGGMGVVYQVLDRERKGTVALKTLRHVDAASIFRLKQEFRALADVAHPNLAGLRELLCVDGQWFFTMEFVDGINFLSYVRAGYELLHADTLDASDCAPASPTGSSTLDEERLRAALRQLVTGVAALHDAGKLHRDIKPSNVLVTRESRVVLLDFGLVTDATPDRPRASRDDLVGTAAYMAPEQATSSPLTPASDWYAVGAMLYEALTGRLPFDGNWFEILKKKQEAEPPRASSLSPGLPPDLDELCMELLRRRPEARPGSVEIQRRLGLEAVSEHRQERSRPSSASLLVGRERHLGALLEAFAGSRAEATVVFVHGSSGMGKSALVRRFLELARPEAVVLTGRCYERESVPYKGFDRLIDELSTYLLSLPTAEVRALLPHHVAAVTRVFPMLRRIAVLANARRTEPEVPDAQELRRRAFAGLRELFARIALKHRLILFIDDLQWGDLDSAALLGELMRAPDAPPLLLVGCYRTEDQGTSPMLHALAGAVAGAREIAVEQLSPDEARTLARRLLEARSPDAEAQAVAIAREAGGSPFFVGELVRYVEEGAGLQPGELTMEKVLGTRLAKLPEPARRLLQVLALFGRPLRTELALRAADLSPDDEAALAQLRIGNLVRTRGAHGQVELYHDRVRETVVALTPEPTARLRHAGLAAALEAYEAADPEVLAVHYRGAGDAERAGEWAQAAARQAAEALAFDRAARLFRSALEDRPNAPNARELKVELGDALVNAGRGPEAAAAYLEARAGAGPTESRMLQRRAAEQFLCSGHVDEGEKHLSEVLRALGMDLPRSPARGLARLVWARARLRLRGHAFTEREAAEVPAELLERIDTCWSVAHGYGGIDVLVSYGFFTRHLLLALKAGEPYRIARGLAIEPTIAATSGAFARAERLVAGARALAERVGNPHARGLVTLEEGVVRYTQGRFKEARALFESAEQLFRERCTGVAWEIATAQMMKVYSLFYLGELAELSRLVPDQIRHAEERGDLFAGLTARMSYPNLYWLLADDVAGARREADDAIRRWSLDGFHVQHFSALTAQVNVDLYSGDGRAAFERLETKWRALTGSMLMRVQSARFEGYVLRGRAALAAARVADSPAPLLRCAEQQIRALEREPPAFIRGLTKLLAAGLAASRGDPARAGLELDAAIGIFDGHDMAVFAVVARYRRGQLAGGADGSALVSAMDARLRAQNVQQPERLVAMLAPGFTDSR